MLSYEYDIFISYPRRADSVACWVRDVFHPELAERLGAELPHRPRIFRDEEDIEIGEQWPEAICHALHRSNLLIAILAAPYASSDWCMAELTMMLERERSCSEQTKFIYPIRFADGIYFPKEAKERQFHDLGKYSALRAENKSAHLYLGLRQEMVDICERLSERLGKFPDLGS